MEQWVWAVLISAALLVVYLLYFYLASLFQRGSPFYITLSYYTKSALRQVGSIGPTLKSWIPKSKPKSRPVRSASVLEAPPKTGTKKPSVSPEIPPRTETVRVGPEKRYEEAKNVRKPDTRPGFSGPTNEPFSLAAARQAIKERRRVWVKYRGEERQQAEEKLEIYRATAGGILYAWFCFKRTRSTLRRKRVISWCVLDERFERTPHLERWVRWKGLTDRPEWVDNLLLKLKRDES